MLRGLLLLRGAFNLLFGIGLLVWSAETTLQGYGRGGFYALVDGLLAFAVAVALRRSRAPWLAVLAFADALVRIVLGVVVLANPEMHRTALGAAFFFAAAVMLCLALGLGGIVYVLVTSRRARAAQGEPVMVWPALVLSAFTVLLGVGLAVGFLDEQRRLMLVVYAIAMGCALCLAGYRLDRSAAA